MELGKVIFETSLESRKEDALILKNAAKIIRQQLFINDETFDGNVSTEHQQASVPIALIYLQYH